MIKAWMIIFVFSADPSGDPYLGKTEVPYSTMKQCVTAKKTMNIEGQDIRFQIICVSDDHHSGKKQDKNVPYD